MPQLFAIITEYEKEFSTSNDTVSNSNLCEMIEYKVNKTQQTLINLIDGADGVICEPVSLIHLIEFFFVCFLDLSGLNRFYLFIHDSMCIFIHFMCRKVNGPFIHYCNF